MISELKVGEAVREDIRRQQEQWYRDILVDGEHWYAIETKVSKKKKDVEFFGKQYYWVRVGGQLQLRRGPDYSLHRDLLEFKRRDDERNV
ncbi:hypothetical protein [Streptomyces sp. CoH17]|uniref:hypothetical protein n=1 Tax=Streptomyces sp. CoH17 TaxID=2992806 RepID=UPI00226ED1DA|nr:hypothetical protein [Streptomyces sp. CoH17]